MTTDSFDDIASRLPTRRTDARFAASKPSMSIDHSRASSVRVRSFGPGARLAPGTADASLFAEAVESIRARLEPDVLDYLDRYRPVGLPKRQRKTLRLFVRDLVSATEPLNTFSVEQCAAPVAGVVAWGHLAKGFPLSRGLLLGDDVVAMYLGHLRSEGLAPGTIRNYRGYLRRVAEAIGVVALAAPAPVVGGSVAPPYSREQEDAFRLWARSDREELGQTRARALVGLAAGAGLRGAEIMLVRVRDVIDEAGVWVVVQGPAARVTPVREEWVPFLRRQLDGRGSDELLFPRSNDANPDLITKWLSQQDRHDRPVPGRLRASWIVSQLRAGASPALLVAWAGVGRGETISRYLQFVPDAANEPLRRRYLHTRASFPGSAES